ncbi:MAG: hypothetical protein H6835_01405 [Planctomycetes bacterium]|nr:hypothetical protein [Planctomycetota bacterium]
MILRLSIVAALSTLLSAQTPPCISFNDANTSTTGSLTAYGFAGPNAYAWQFTPAQPLVLQSAQVYTGNTFLTGSGFMTLEIWDTNFIFTPGQRLGGGTFRSEISLGVDWHGANFDTPVVCNAGQTYWLVWREPGFSETPEEPGGVQATTCSWNGSSWQTQATSWAPKWRGFCGLLDAQGVTPIGLGCGTSQGALPGMFTNHAPTIGDTDFTLEACNFPAGSIGACVLGTDPSWVSFLIPGGPVGCELHTDLAYVPVVTTGTGANERAQHSTGYAGHVVFPFPIPNVPALAGAIFNSQFAILDLPSGAPLPFVVSNGLRFTLF